MKVTGTFKIDDPGNWGGGPSKVVSLQKKVAMLEKKVKALRAAKAAKEKAAKAKAAKKSAENGGNGQGQMYFAEVIPACCATCQCAYI
eukprot:CAMPEP_0114556640 /NCGR_PEP_ID=MMETSP0114-20121206/9397_1 /TAXON_ID=31324 /ORGANISM="Goniomonas sp, Strain m" /LENGTH=87 /DNA_ID=CAMNT_0001741859 /DNA_START=288 /DNA_END=551 /DNA_ORIENTATION=-